MQHKEILLQNYLPELSVLYSFSRYSDMAFSDQNLYSRIVNEEMASVMEIGKDFLVDPVNGPEQMKKALAKEVPKKVADDINKGLTVLRRQLLEAAYSIFENFLCHVLRVYLHTFPQILKNIDKSIAYRQIVDLADNESVYNYIVEKEIDHFSHRSLQEKKEYFAKRLHISNAENIWVYEGEELWTDIDKKRQAIVHKEEVPEISDIYLLRAINYFQRAMMGISLNAQVEQGIPFTWGPMSQFVKKKEQPEL